MQNALQTVRFNLKKSTTRFKRQCIKHESANINEDTCSKTAGCTNLYTDKMNTAF